MTKPFALLATSTLVCVFMAFVISMWGQSSALAPDLPADLDTYVMKSMQVFDVPGDVELSSITEKPIDRALEAIDEHLVIQPMVHHGEDVRLILRLEAFQLAHDDVHDIENRDLEVL